MKIDTIQNKKLINEIDTNVEFLKNTLLGVNINVDHCPVKKLVDLIFSRGNINSYEVYSDVDGLFNFYFSSYLVLSAYLSLYESLNMIIEFLNIEGFDVECDIFIKNGVYYFYITEAEI